MKRDRKRSRFLYATKDAAGEECGGQRREKTMAEEMITAKDEEQLSA